jgi:hypothetical protein
MQLFGSKCSECGANIPRGAKFCPQCGAGAPSGKVKCTCGASVAATAKFCPECGRELKGAIPPTIEKHRWARGPDDFAVRVEVSDVPGFFGKDIVVEQGTKGIFFINGRNEGEVGPGKYNLDTLADRILMLGRAESTTVILVDESDVQLDFTVTDLFTKDPLRLNLDCKLVVQMMDPMLFLTNEMKGRRSYPLSLLKSALYDEAKNAAQECVGKRSVRELGTDLSLKQEFEQEIEAHLNTTFQRSGLRLAQLRTLNYRHPEYDQVGGIHQEVFLQLEKRQAELEGKRLLLDVHTAEQLQEIAEETAKVEQNERRAEVWERMRRAVLSDKMDEVRTEEELEVFLTGVDRQHLIREKEISDLKRTFGEEREDHELARAHVLRTLEVQRRIELDRIELLGETDLLELRLKKRQAELEGALAEERMRAVAGKQTELEVHRVGLQAELEKAKTQAEVDRIRREQDEADMQLGMLGLQLIDERKLKKQREEMLIDLERQEKEARIRIDEERARHEMEKERLEVLSTFSVEALIAASEPDRAALLAEIKRTQTLKDFSEEQILAMAADKSPQVAQAFQEKFRAIGSAEAQEQLREMYERVVAEQKAATVDLKELQRENARRLQEMFEKALETQRDTAAALARGESTPTIVFPPGGGGPLYVGGAHGAEGQAGDIVVCRNCGVKSPVGTQFCSNCGARFYEARGEE